MGKVNEYDMDKINLNECIPLLSTQVNQSTELSVSALPISFGVYINEDLIYSCNVMKNAEMLYRVICADLAGKVYC